MPQQSSDPTPRATRPLTLTPTNPAYPVERASDSAVLRAIPGARMRAKIREMRAAVTRMTDVERAAVTEPLPPGSRVTPPLGSRVTPRAIPRFAIGEVVSHPRSRQIGRIGGPPRPWSTGLKWPVHWLRNVRGNLCWTPGYTEVWQEELESIQ